MEKVYNIAVAGWCIGLYKVFSDVDMRNIYICASLLTAFMVIGAFKTFKEKEK